MLRRALLCALVLSLTVVAPALASPRSDHIHRHHTLTSWADDRGDRGVHNRDDVWRFYSSRDGSEDDSDSFDSGSDGADESDTGDSTTDTGSDVTAPVTGTQAVVGGSGAVLTGAEKTISAELTAYDHEDNQGGNNARICCGTWHREAGGTGTFADPITVAVPGSGSSMETKAGTRIYVPALQVYLGVEDSGATPTGKLRLDVWIDGRGLSSASECMDRVTRTTPVIVNAAAGKPVGHVGPIADASGCHVATSGNG